jgi:hypothetical protein
MAKLGIPQAEQQQVSSALGSPAHHTTTAKA